MPLQHQPRPRRMTARVIGTAALALSLSSLAAGCSDDGGTEAGSMGGDRSPTRSPTDDAPSRSAAVPDNATPTAPAGAELKVIVDGSSISPNGATLDLAVGEPLSITFKTDRAGELHVHSRPEQIISFGAGTTTQQLVIDNPGAVDVEEHATGTVVAQLAVR
jgi:hypothetical protein